MTKSNHKEKRNTSLCLIEDCLKKSVVKKYCPHHYYIMTRYGSLAKYAKAKKRNKCFEKTCDSSALVNGLYCTKHLYICSKYGSVKKHKAYKAKKEAAKLKNNPCVVQGCLKKAVGAKGYCWGHYRQLRRFGKIVYVKRKCNAAGCDQSSLSKLEYWCENHWRKVKILKEHLEMKASARCAADDCPRHRIGKKYCAVHSYQIRTYGKITDKEKRCVYNICSVKECAREVRSLNLCTRHYFQNRNHGRLTPELERRVKPRGECRYEKCRKISMSSGLCRAHYQKLRREKKKSKKLKDI